MSSEKQSPQAEEVKRETDVYDLLAWFEVNRKKVGIAALVFVVIGFLAATIRYLKREKEAKASAELLALKPTLTPQTNMPVAQASALLKVAEDFKGTSAGERARILAATALFSEGRYAEAEREFSRFIQDFSGSPWVPNAAYGLAASQEAANKTNEAFASYQNVLAAHASSPVAHGAKIALARIYEGRNQADQAIRLYNELTSPIPGGSPGEGPSPEVQARKEALLRAHPELNTNRVAALPPPPATVPTNLPATNATSTNAQVVNQTNEAPLQLSIPGITNAPVKP